MAFTIVQFIRFVQVAVASAQTTQYTTSASRQDVVKCIDVANTTGGQLTFTLNLVPTGNSAGTANQLIPTVGIPANTVLHWTGTQVMNAGDFLSTAASGTGLTMTVSGLESQ